MHESSGSLSSSPRSIAHSSTAKASPTASPIFLARKPNPVTDYDHSGLTSFDPVGLTSPNPIEIAVSTSYGPAGCALPPRRSQGSLWVDLCPAPKALLCVDSCPAPNALPWEDSCSSPKALSWVGSCPALNLLPWVGSPSPLPHFTIFAHTSHV